MCNLVTMKRTSLLGEQKDYKPSKKVRLLTSIFRLCQKKKLRREILTKLISMEFIGFCNSAVLKMYFRIWNE